MTLDEALDRIDELEQALLKIRQWCDAYPVDIFTDLSEDEVKTCVEALHGAVRNGSDRMHACWARHILSGVRKLTAPVSEQ